MVVIALPHLRVSCRPVPNDTAPDRGRHPLDLHQLCRDRDGRLIVVRVVLHHRRGRSCGCHAGARVLPATGLSNLPVATPLQGCHPTRHPCSPGRYRTRHPAGVRPVTPLPWASARQFRPADRGSVVNSAERDVRMSHVVARANRFSRPATRARECSRACGRSTCAASLSVRPGDREIPLYTVDETHRPAMRHRCGWSGNAAR